MRAAPNWYSMEFLFRDNKIVVCVKPAGVLSTDEPGGMPELIREALGEPDANIRTVHRLDRVVGGLMVFAGSKAAASDLGRQIAEHEFEKEYFAVVHGHPKEAAGRYTDMLKRDREKRITYAVNENGRDVQEAELDYRVLESTDGFSLVRIRLLTGRTHQIRAQFSSRNMPLVGDKKYGITDDGCETALWSFRLRFKHPKTKEVMDFRKAPPKVFPWTEFENIEGYIEDEF